MWSWGEDTRRWCLRARTMANEMAGNFTVVVGVMVAVVLHAVNFTMGCFSPAIQALRLHYVEFFDKFYQDGGRPYEPFSLTS